MADHGPKRQASALCIVRALGPGPLDIRFEQHLNRQAFVVRYIFNGVRAWLCEQDCYNQASE